MTSEQLFAARAERMRQNGPGTLTFEDARTWIEETGLCLFLPRRQFAASVAPTFVEAIAGRQNPTPDARQIKTAEEMLVRLETQGIAVRLNLLGLPGEQPDFVVAGWVLPYVYALRGDRDWRRNPQLTGSRQVSPLAVQAYKLLDAGEATVSQLKQALGREVTEAAVLRAITELWQQLRIIPVVSAPGQPARWQLLRTRFQKAIAEGASTSQVTAISVLASIFLQAVIAASMEEVESFLSPLTARSKIREVLRGLVATRQVHTIALGHAPHFYVAGTLPEFAATPTTYSSAYISVSSTFTRSSDVGISAERSGAATPHPAKAPETAARQPHRPARKPVSASKPATPRPHFSRASDHSRDRKRAPHSGSGSRPARRTADARPSASRAQTSSRPASAGRWSKTAPKTTPHARHNGNGASFAHNGNGNGHGNGSRPKSGVARGAKSSSWNGTPRRAGSTARTSTRAKSHPSGSRRKPALSAGAKAGNSKRYGFTARPRPGKKKRG